MSAQPGRLAENVAHFGRLLRAAGLPVGSDRILDAVRTLTAVGVARRDDAYWALHAVFVSRRDQHELFDRAFALFWREPGGMEDALAALLPKIERPGARGELPRRLAEAWGRRARAAPRPTAPPRGDATASWSDRETLRHSDFAEMSADEVRRARALITQLVLPIPPRATRRFRPDPRGSRLDLRRTLRASLRSGGHDLPLRRRERVRRPPPVVLLCDISGSMERYARVLLHFAHALTEGRSHVSTFLFGTRVHQATHVLRHRDVDGALARLGAQVSDWSGGTRIGRCLREFNLRWSRRVLTQGALVLLVSDGLDRDDGAGIAREAARLRRSCRRLVWLNPLLRYAGFEPRAAGIRALLPHVDELRPVHDLASLEDLAAALAQPAA